jgi:hypothetical protein
VKGAALGLVLAAAPLEAQGPGFQLGRYYAETDATTYRAGATGAVLGPVGGAVHAVYYDGRRPVGNLAGLGVDVSFFRSGRSGVYLVAGLEGGLGIEDGSRTLWGSWGAGLGYELLLLRGLSLAAEGRYRVVNVAGHDGIEVGVRLGSDRASRSRRPRSNTAPPPPERTAVRDRLREAGLPEAQTALVAGVVQTALEVMGMPYRWGDEGEGGFDCSGLIRYAFGAHGIALPRRSADQAREGVPVERRVEALRPGDLLTFATGGDGRISHVGLYVGNGRFIHSASGGVQLSMLSPDDVSGRWWWHRWVGARRIVDAPAP